MSRMPLPGAAPGGRARWWRSRRLRAEPASVLGIALVVVCVAATACDSSDDYSTEPTPPGPDPAPRAVVDRFSPAAATLFERGLVDGLPGPNVPVNFDRPPFLVHGLGPGGEHISYYNFDVQSDIPALLYVFHRSGDENPVAGQLSVINDLPGEPGYNDFRRIVRVIVPADYVANTLTSLAAINAAGYPQQITNRIVNVPVVPAGSTASLRVSGPAALQEAWYRDQVASYFAFAEHPVETAPGDRVPLSVVLAAYNINPGEPGGGIASGFRTEPGTDQTHNVVAALPGDLFYTPYHGFVAYHTDDFATVTDLATALAARLIPGFVLINSPVARVP